MLQMLLIACHPVIDLSDQILLVIDQKHAKMPNQDHMPYADCY